MNYRGKLRVAKWPLICWTVSSETHIDKVASESVGTSERNLYKIPYTLTNDFDGCVS